MNVDKAILELDTIDDSVDSKEHMMEHINRALEHLEEKQNEIKNK